MAALTTEVIGTIGAVQTLIENFPMSIFELFGNKTYTNPIDFIMDVLRQLGISDAVLVDKLIELFFNVPNAVELYSDVANYKYKYIKKPTEEQIQQAVKVDDIPTTIDSDSPNYIFIINENETKSYYRKTAPVPTELQSEFLNGVEFSVKGIIQNILTGLLSCSIIPEIPESYMDTSNIQFIFPKDSFDISGLLNINPLTDIGKNFYSGVDDEDLTVNDLYKTNDLNAFIWYSMNRGTIQNQKEKNKMMWDSRIVSENEGNEDDKRTTPEKWNSWLNSKNATNDFFYTENNELKYLDATTGSNKTVDIPLHPILQFEPTNFFGNNKGIRVSFPYQTWHKDEGIFNKSIYRFNIDYLNNIQIFNPRLIITEMINTLLNGNLSIGVNLNYSIQTKILESRINTIIKKALEEDDATVEDCFFSFSNDEYNEALKNMELQKYNAKQLNSETSPAIKIEENFGLDAVNEINSMATLNEKISTITKTVYDISAIPAQDAAIEITDKLSLDFNEKWINDVVMALVMPLAKAILTPKVMLLFLINFQIMGMININDIKSINDVMDLILKKMIAIIISLVRYIKDKIIEFLLKLFFDVAEELIVKWGILVLKEKLDAWLTLLAEAISCIPLFSFGKVLTEIDDVNYADITQTQDIPKTEEKC